MRILSIFLIGLFSFIAYKNRFRLMNGLFGNRMIRKVVIASIMSIPIVRDQMMKAVFSVDAKQ